MSFPPRWTGSQFKHDMPNSKVERRNTKLALATAERRNKEKVRSRDKGCRFPLCGCKKFRRQTHVSHATHKGMGGDPTGERSLQSGMVLLCPFRHTENRYSIDRGTLKWEALTDDGAKGPIAWFMATGFSDKPWLCLAHETAVQQLDKLTPRQRKELKRLAEMDI